MPRKNRYLRLNVKATSLPANISRDKFIATLIESAETGNYRLPDGWEVQIEWSNYRNGRMKHGPWEEEMESSSKNGRGWDMAVTTWLRRKL
jgi:hypothetical protein